jgi:hypothetical protein
MSIDTEKLIERLAAAVEPVRPLARPWIRTAAWLLVAIPYVALAVFVVSPRGDLISKALEWRYLVEQLAALATGIAAATAAFATVIPGYDRRFLFLPALPLAIWLGSLGDGCVEDWIHFGPAGLSLRPEWFCFPSIVLVGAIPAIVMVVMLRRGAPLTPHITAALGGLAAAGLVLLPFDRSRWCDPGDCYGGHASPWRASYTTHNGRPGRSRGGWTG